MVQLAIASGAGIIGASTCNVEIGDGHLGVDSVRDILQFVGVLKSRMFLFRVDDWEVMQLQYCRTIVVLRHMKSVHKERVMLLCGADLLKSFGVPGVWRPEDVSGFLLVRVSMFLRMGREGSVMWIVETSWDRK